MNDFINAFKGNSLILFYLEKNEFKKNLSLS